MWKRSDIDPNKQYVIQLCHDDHGTRMLRLRELDGEPLHPDAVFETGPVSNELLLQGDIFKIAEITKLANGKTFDFDAHGIWFTAEELAAFHKNQGDLNSVPWSTKTPPVLAPN